jgi:hypothetical protein
VQLDESIGDAFFELPGHDWSDVTLHREIEQADLPLPVARIMIFNELPSRLVLMMQTGAAHGNLRFPHVGDAPAQQLKTVHDSNPRKLQNGLCPRTHGLASAMPAQSAECREITQM